MNPSQEENIKAADALYEQRGRPGSVLASLKLLEKDEWFSAYDVAWRIGRALFFLGQEAVEDKAKKDYHSRGAAASERAVKLEPSRVEGCFWLGVNLALLAAAAPKVSAISKALRARRFLIRAVEIDATYHGAGPLRVLARLQHQLPAFLGGGTTRARANFERALSIAPANSVTRRYYAELLFDIGDAKGARKQLEGLLNTPDEPGWTFESARDREYARRLLANRES